MNAPLVIVGTGISGYGLLRAMRRNGQQREIVLITADDGAAYSRSQLHQGMAGGKEASDLVLASVEQMSHRFDATVQTHTRVLAIDRERHMLRTGRGETAYSQLVLATGAEVLRPPGLRGSAVNKILSIGNLADYRYFRHQLVGRQRIAILGGNAVACEFADHLVRGGCEVALFEPGGRLLGQRLPVLCARRLARALTACGVRLALGDGVQRVDQSLGELELTSLSGLRLRADVVVTLLGVRPCTELAQDAGLLVRSGIVVDSELRTLDPDIFALGRCAELAGRSFEHPHDIEAGCHALACVLSGQAVDMRWAPRVDRLQLEACPVVLCEAPTVRGEWQETATRSGVTARFHDRSGDLRGFALVGDAVTLAEPFTSQLAR